MQDHSAHSRASCGEEEPQFTTPIELAIQWPGICAIPVGRTINQHLGCITGYTNLLQMFPGVMSFTNWQWAC